MMTLVISLKRMKRLLHLERLRKRDVRGKGKKRRLGGNRLNGVQMSLVWTRGELLVQGLGYKLTVRSWDEIFEVFGAGDDYDWALAGEDGIQDDDYKTRTKPLPQGISQNGINS
jgi:hypothetical protein